MIPLRKEYYTKENIEKCIELLDTPKDPYELSYNMFETFISNIKTIDTKEISLELLNNKINNLKEEIKTIKKIIISNLECEKI